MLKLALVFLWTTISTSRRLEMCCNGFGALRTREIMLNNLAQLSQASETVILNAFVWIVNRELIVDRNQEQ